MQDITVGNRLDISDPRDPGGRLGPYVHDCEPDLRNLSLGCVPCEEGDIICVVSDGVHDNLDPAFLGYEPSDLGLGRPGDLAYKDWDSIEDKTLVLKAKTAFVHEFLQLNVLGEEGKAEAQRIQNEGIAAASTFVDTSSISITPALLTRRLIEHCWRTTARSREFVEQRPNSHLPLDYKTFPGKMDHR
jgi:hypothetical protein